jgi:hypothetical protein
MVFKDSSSALMYLVGGRGKGRIAGVRQHPETVKSIHNGL